jgi:hypothetical protein
MPGDHLEQGRLAGSVQADERDAIARSDEELRVA